MNPSEVRESILEQHDDLRRRLSALRELAAKSPSRAAQTSERLRDVGLQTLSALSDHLDYEDLHLLPALREADSWGDERARLVSAEHAEQRELFRYIVDRLHETERPGLLLARELETLVDALLVDMAEEEKTMLNENLLRDDVVGIDVEGG